MTPSSKGYFSLVSYHPRKTKEKENTSQLALINLYFFFVKVSNTTLHEKN